MGLFFLLTLYGAIRGASSGHPWRWYAAAIAACALGMGAKEVMATAPIDGAPVRPCFLSGSFREAFRRRRPFYLGPGGDVADPRRAADRVSWARRPAPGFGLAEVGPWEYARTQPGVILHYLRLSFWPSSLCFDYCLADRDERPADHPGGGRHRGAAGRDPVGAAPGACARVSRRVVLPGPGAELRASCRSSRRSPPSGGCICRWRPSWRAASFAAYWLGNKSVRRVTESAGTRKLLGGAWRLRRSCRPRPHWAMRTFERNTDYRDAISIWQERSTSGPGTRGQNNLGTSYFEAGRPDEALACFSKAIELKPDYFDA